MDEQVRLDFLRQLLANMNVSSCVVTGPGAHIPTQIDLNLRAKLFGLRNYSGFLQNSMSQAKVIKHKIRVLKTRIEKIQKAITKKTMLLARLITLCARLEACSGLKSELVGKRSVYFTEEISPFGDLILRV